MPDVNVTVSTFPNNISVYETDNQIVISQLGIQGAGNSSSNESIAGITGVSITGGYPITGILEINAGQNVSLTQVGSNSFFIAATTGGSSDISGLISTGNADLRYYPLNSNPNNYITGFNSGDYVTYNEFSNIVYTTGDQTISGDKTFTDVFINKGSTAGLGAAIKFVNESQQHYTIGVSGANFLIANTSDLGNSIWGNNPITVLKVDEFNNLYGPDGRLISIIDSGNLQGQIDLLSGYVDDNFYLSSNPNNYITGFNSGTYVLKIETGNYTGVFYPRFDNPSGYINSSYLTTYATLSNLAVTSGELLNQIDAINNGTGNFAVVHVTGSNFILNPNFTGVGGTNVYLSGNLVCISGGGGEVDLSNYATINFVGQTSGSLSERIGSTGSYLLNLINASSAGVSSINSQSGAMTLNGAGNVSVLTNGQTITVSGDTGAYINFATITNLATTGSTLDGKINSLSGYSNDTFYLATNPNNYIDSATANVTYATIINLAATGSILDEKINSLSGYSSDTFATTDFVQEISGVLSERVGDTGSYLLDLINASSAGVSSINSQSGAMTLQGAGNVSVSTDNQTITISGNTGVYINFATVNQLNSLSGYSNLIFATDVNLISTGQNLQSQINSINNTTGIFITTGQTGQFYPASNPENYITSSTASSTYATIINLASTGQQAWTAANNNAVNLSGNLQITGSTLDSKINNLSGYSNSTFATIANLQSTGQQAWNTANNNALNLSGDLQTTGTTLNDRINSLSGYSNDSFYLKTNPDSYAQSGRFISGISITGGIAIQGAFNINAGTNITLDQIGGNTLSISASSDGQSVVGVTGISVTGGYYLTGGINFTGIGGMEIIHLGNTIQFSGGGGGEGDIINNNNYYINSGSGSFIFKTEVETGISLKFIEFPNTFENSPIVVASLSNNYTNNILALQVSGVTTSGYWGLFSETVSDSGYYINSIACDSESTGLATTVIINQNFGGNTEELILSPNLHSGSVLNLDNKSFYIHTGYSIDTWILPTAVSMPGHLYFIKNKGNSVLLTGTSNQETLFTTEEVLTMTILSGEAYIVGSDGQYQWMIM